MIFIIALLLEDEEKGKEGAGKEDAALSPLHLEKKVNYNLHFPAEIVPLQRKILKIY